MSRRKAISPSFGVLAGLAEWIGTSSVFGGKDELHGQHQSL